MHHRNPNHATFLGPTLGLALAGSCAAATITVDDDLQDLPSAQFTTLQAAVAAAAVGDEILVYPGVYRETLTCSKAIVIRSAAGPLHTLIDGEHTRGCAVLGGTPLSPTGMPVTLSGFTLANGAAPRGAGVLALDWVRLERCRITACTALFGGGGLYAEGADQVLVEIHDVEISECTVENGDGGGISIKGLGPNEYGWWHHELSRISVTGRLHLQDNTARRGGGLALDCATFDETQNDEGPVTFQGNHAEGYGGGVYAAMSAFLTSPTTSMRFEANSTGADGAGIFFSAFHSAYPSAAGPVGLDLDDVAFTGNTAVEAGGGLYVSDGLARLRRCRFQDNVTLQDTGGAIMSASATLRIQDSFFADNLASSNSPSTPMTAGIEAFAGDLEIRRSWFENHEVALGIANANTSVGGSMFLNNGIGILNQVNIASYLQVRNCRFESNGSHLVGPGVNLGGNVLIP